MFIRNTFIFSFLLGLLSLSSCVILSPKKYKALLATKDSLNVGWISEQEKLAEVSRFRANLERDTAGLNARIRRIQVETEELQSEFKNLRSNSSTEINKLMADLKSREQRLKEVEDVMSRREDASQLLKNKLQNALLGFTKSGLSVEMREGKVYVSLTDKLLFPTGSIVLDERGKLALGGLAEVLKQHPEINIAVEGHTDSQKISNLGQIKDNWDLSVLRSTSVVRYLTEVSLIESTRMTATGKGEYQPLVSNDTAENRSRNRRIEIVLSPKLDELYELVKK